MARIVITEFMDNGAVEFLQTLHDVDYRPDLFDDPGALLEALGGAEAVIVRNRTQVSSMLLDAAPALRVIGRLGVGLDNIDLDACAAHSVAVRPAIGANAVAVAEYVIGAMLVLIRGVFSAAAQVIRGDWPRTELTGGELFGRTLGLVGYGSIARQVASRAAALGMKILAHDPYLAEHADLDPAERALWSELLRLSDVVSVHVPLVPETRYLIDEVAISSMRDGAIVINTSRGGVVNETHIVDALRAGKLGGAALDVFEDEPPSAARLTAFADTPNLLLTPHIAGVTKESNVRVSRVVAEAVVEELAHA